MFPNKPKVIKIVSFYHFLNICVNILLNIKWFITPYGITEHTADKGDEKLNSTLYIVLFYKAHGYAIIHTVVT